MLRHYWWWMVVFTFWEEHRDGWRGAFWDTTCFSPSSGKSHTEAPSQLYACSKCAEMERLMIHVHREPCTRGQLCTCLRLNLLLNILWQYWHIRGCLDFQEGPSRAAIWSGPSSAAIWSAALVPSTLWDARNIIVRLKSLMYYQEIEGGGARGGEQRRG